MKPIIIYPPTIEWGFLYQRPQQLLKALATLDCICIFCNPNGFKCYSTGYCRLSDNLILANGVSFRSVMEWARASYPDFPLIGYFTYPAQIELVRQAKPHFILFDSVDEPVGEFANWLPYYAKAVQQSDIVTASATSLMSRAAQYSQYEILLLPNGCDFPHFLAAQTPQPIDCEPFNHGKPIIGYIGAIAPWLDWSLLHTMAHFLPSYDFVFIGPRLLNAGIGITSSNMHYLGQKDYAELPRYMSNFNYCLIPFSLTEMTKGVNPIKFWEYLASGHPILSTSLPEVPPEYVTIISEAMFPGFIPGNATIGREERIRLARDNSWLERATKLLDVICSRLESG